MSYQALYRIALTVLLAVCGVSLRVLFAQLVAKKVVFERHVIGTDYYLLGIRVRQRWFSVHRIDEWIMKPRKSGLAVSLAIRYRDGDEVMLIEALDRDLWLSLVVRMQRKDFVYV